MIDQPPESLVIGCNGPISIGILSDWIEEQYGIALNYEQSGWSDGYGYGIGHERANGDGAGRGYDHGDGNGFGDGFVNGIGFGFFNGNGLGYGYDFGYGWGNGDGYGWGDVTSCGDENDMGYS